MARRARRTRWTQKARGLLLALAPALIASALVAASLAVRVTTPVALEVTTDSVTFTVSERTGDDGSPMPLLNHSTPFSALTLERCGSVVLPALRISAEGTPPSPSAGDIRFRCAVHQGAKVSIRSSEPGAMGLGSVDRVTAQPGDTVRLELAGTDPIAVRLQMAGNATLGFSLRQEVPFVIATELVEADGVVVPPTATRVVWYDAVLPRDSSSRQVTTTGLNMLSAVIEFSDAGRAATLFADNLDLPLSSLSLFRQDPVTRAFESTVAFGELTFPTLGTPNVPFRKGHRLRFGAADGIRLTSLRIDAKQGGLAMIVEGDAGELSVNGVDRRVRLFDRLVSDRNRNLVAIAALLASQLVWLRKAWK